MQQILDLDMQADDGQTLGSNYIHVGDPNMPLEKEWQDSLQAEGYQEAQHTMVPVLFGRSLEVSLVPCIFS